MFPRCRCGLACRGRRSAGCRQTAPLLALQPLLHPAQLLRPAGPQPLAEERFVEQVQGLNEVSQLADPLLQLDALLALLGRGQLGPLTASVSAWRVSSYCWSCRT